MQDSTIINIKLNKMKTFSKILVILLLTVCAQSTHWSGNVLYDLEFYSEAFRRETDSWISTIKLAQVGQKTIQCGSEIMLGGPSIWLAGQNSVFEEHSWSKKYFNLPVHKAVKLEMTFYVFDNWVGEDGFSVNYETGEARVFTPKQALTTGTNKCGSNQPIITFYATFQHVQDSLTLRVKTNIFEPSSTGSVGFRNIVLTFLEEIPSTGFTSCSVSSVNPLSSDNFCGCSEKTPMSPPQSGLCEGCDASCLTCNAPGSCTSCHPGSYLTQTGQCLPCSSSCQTCSGSTAFCTTCQENFYFVDFSCYPSCENPYYSIPADNMLFCYSRCNSQEYAYMWTDDNCETSCDPPLVKEKRGNTWACKFPCEDTSLYLNWDGTCGTACPYSSDQEKLFFGVHLCDFPCTNSEDYLYWDGLCVDSCPDPLVEIEVGGKKSCSYPCEANQFLYDNGICKPTCPSPYTIEIQHSRNFCVLKCPENQYLDDEGNCQIASYPDEFSLRVRIDDEMIDLTFIDRTLKAENEEFNIFGKKYTISSTWAFFSLNLAEKYSLDNWDTNSKCGCFQQVCGKDCDGSLECQYNLAPTEKTPWFCHPWAQRNSYCWSVISSGQKNYSSYSLSQISTISLTSYGGPDVEFISPGFTLNNNLLNQKYALNALAMHVTSRGKVDLTSSYRYVESDRRVITSQEFAKINIPPKIEANLDAAKCNSTTVDLPLTLSSQSFGPNNQTITPFHLYNILRRAQKPTLTVLLNQDILGPNGVVEWNNQDTFDFLDPCNQQFFTLRKDPKGNYFVNMPATQRLANSESIICIAINDLASSQYDLVLYELRNNTSVWSASDRFVGLVSKDYVEDTTLRLTVKASQTLSLSEVKVQVGLHTDVDPPFIVITTTAAAVCQLYLSPLCNLEVSITDDLAYVKQDISKCGRLYEKAGYTCDGISGYFYPPNKNGYAQENLNNKAFIENFSKAVPSTDELSIFKNWITNWTWQNAPTKILIMMIIPLSLFFTCRKLYKELKGCCEKHRYSPLSRVEPKEP